MRAFLRRGLFGLLLFAGTAYAASYVYDANGRLRAVTASSGTSSEYTYDALGNLLGVQSIPAGQLAIFAFTPNHGPAGITVTIAGQGFSTSPASNAVKFNGTLATVTSASATQLMVTVPAGATTGPIAVAVGSATATSADNFVVTADAGGLLPVITAFTPVIATPGSAIAVSGSHFLTTAGPTQAGVDVYTSTVTPASDVQLGFSVPAQAGSGYVTVSTPYGSTQSAQPLVVVPASIGAGNVLSATNLVVDGAPQAINISTANKFVAATFQGTAGQWLSLQFSQFSTAPAGYSGDLTVYDPSGAVIVYGSSFNVNPPLSKHLPRLPRTGTYLVLFNADAGTTAQFTVSLESNPVVSTSPVAVASTVAGQTKRIVFDGLAAQYLGLNFVSLTTTPANRGIVIQPNDPDGVYDGPVYNSLWGQYASSVATAEVDNFAPLPHSGEYTVVLEPGAATMAVMVDLVPNPTGILVVDGASLSEATTAPNENGYITFNATAGQNVSVGVGSVTTSPSVSTVYYEIDRFDGLALSTGYCYLPGCHIPLTNVALTGAYYVTIYPSNAVAMQFTATLSSAQTGSLTPNTPFAVNLNRPGQIARLNFAGTQGQYISLYLGNVATAPAGGNVTITVTNPDGSSIQYGATKTTSNGILNLSALAQTGNYTVQVEADNADTATAQLTLLPDPAGAMTVNGPSVAEQTSEPGEYAYLTFNGTAGQNLSLALGAISITPANASYNIYALVYAPNGAEIGSELEAPVSTGGHLVLPSLPQTGTYNVLVFPNSAATFGFTATLSSAQTGSLTPNTPFAVNLNRPGQIARLNFAGTQGQYISLYLGNVATAPAGGNVTITVTNPDGSSIQYGATKTTSNGILNLSALAQTGNYTVQVEADNADTATAQLTLIPDPTGTLTQNGASVSASTTEPSENAYLTFAGTAGENVTLALSNVTASPSSVQYVYAQVIWPDGGEYTNPLAVAPGSGGHLVLTNLSQTGTYVIALYPSSAGTMGFTATLTSP